MLKVAIDTTPLKSPHQFRGLGFYTKNLIEALKTIDTGEIKIEPVNFRKTHYSLLITHYSLLHYPYFEPFFLSLPLGKKVPIVVTVHDIIPLVFPEHFPKGLRGWWKWQIQKFALKRAKMIITDSQNSKKDILRLLRIKKEGIAVIYLAPGKEFKKLDTGDKSLIKIKSKYQLPARFILYVGDLNWNKNIGGLVRAFAKVKTQGVKLVLVGKAFEDESLQELKDVKKLIADLKLEKEVMMLGFIPSEDLVAIYNLATLYCQPSFYEGFGLPVLEAMACGCPVVCSHAASLPEIGGEAALYVNPQYPQEIAEKINKILDFNKLDYQKQVQKGLEQVEKCSWQKTAKETLKVYKEITKSEG